MFTCIVSGFTGGEIATISLIDGSLWKSTINK